MNDEVKEILDGMKKANNENCNLWLENVSVKLLYNYITNLQNDLKYQKEMEDEYIEKHTKLLQDFTNLQEENEDLKDRLKVMEHFKNSLQEENERLKKENIKLYKKDTKIINELKEELEITQEKWNKDKQWSECRTKEWLDYKSRCEKATELIEKSRVKATPFF